MTRIGQRGHSVLYVETGSFVGRDLKQLRGADRRSMLRQHLATEDVAPGVRVMKAPNVAPWGHRYRGAAEVNSALTTLAIRSRRRSSEAPTILWLYDPCFAGCVGKTGERFAVYDCVDDYAEQAGADAAKRALVRDYDELAASRSRLVFATATPLLERHRARNPQTYLVRNVGDFGHFAPAADRALVAGEVAALARPVIGFAGNFLPGKVDFALLEEIASRRPEWTMLLVGPAREGASDRVARLASRENVHWVGVKSYEDLPRYVAAFDVATIPYLRNTYTESCFPLKTFEYLAAGKPVVAAGLPELEGMEPHVAVADDPGAFVAAVERALVDDGPSSVAARQQVAAANTWETRTERLLELIAQEL
jgi:glycosyltransferase involved in cell wall biosynthesis